MKSHIATIINYCTNDARFLNLCIEQALKFSSQVIIAVCDHFFDGTPENQELLTMAYQQHPECTFVEFAYDPDRTYSPYYSVTSDDENWSHYWHSTSRYVGYFFLEEAIEYVLFLDVDEIVDSERFTIWLERSGYQNYDAARFYSYFYYRSAEFRAISPTLNALLVKKAAIETPEMLLTEYERKGVFDQIIGAKLNHVVGYDDQPLVDHYSWVRTKEELLLKVATWGHRTERDWTSLVEEEFTHPFSGEEKIFGLRYEKVIPRFDPLKLCMKKTELNPEVRLPHVKKVDRKSLQEMALLKEFS